MHQPFRKMNSEVNLSLIHIYFTCVAVVTCGDARVDRCDITPPYYGKCGCGKNSKRNKRNTKYLALYTKGGKFVGYINKKAVKRLGSAKQPEQGKAYTYRKRVKIKSKKY